jgi:plasmid maintenance system killer protein
MIASARVATLKFSLGCDFHLSYDNLKNIAAHPGRYVVGEGNRKGQYSMRINEKWRICFEWPIGSSGPTNVEIVDYH